MAKTPTFRGGIGGKVRARVVTMKRNITRAQAALLVSIGAGCPDGISRARWRGIVRQITLYGE